jgi:hypothetical protein
MIYQISGSKTGGWDVRKRATSLHEARRIARDLRGEFPADDSNSSVCIERNGQRIEWWRGSAETQSWSKTVC